MFIKAIPLLLVFGLILSLSHIVLADSSDRDRDRDREDHDDRRGPMSSMTPSGSSSSSSQSTSANGCMMNDCYTNEPANSPTEQAQFLNQNHQNLSENAVQGKGPHLEALALIMGCPQESLAEFSVLLKTNYQSIFAQISEQQLKNNSFVILNRLNQTLTSNKMLSQECGISIPDEKSKNIASLPNLKETTLFHKNLL